MKINGIAILPNRTQQKQPFQQGNATRSNITQPTDMFVKSPTFGSYKKLMPFFEGGIEYTPKNLKIFNNLLEKTDLSGDVLKTLIDKVKLIPIKEQDLTFNCDFLIRYANTSELNDPLNRVIFKYLPYIEFSEENIPKVEAILDNFLSDADGPAYYLDKLREYAFREKNAPLLKLLLKDGAQYFKKFVDNDEWVCDNIFKSISSSQDTKDPEIRALFSGDNLYNIVKDCPRDAYNQLYRLDMCFDIIERMPEGSEKNWLINEFVKFVMTENYGRVVTDENLEFCAKLPMLNYERSGFVLTKHVDKIMEKRIRNIVSANGFDAPINLLNCLKDKLMSVEMLTQKFENTTLIEEIAKIPLDENNQEIMSVIMNKLSKYPHLKDDEASRKAGIYAAEQGNTELLKFLDSRHIHYANNLTKPIEDYPKDVQEILKNAKVADPQIFQHATSIKELQQFLENNPRVDINTVNEEGKTLLMTAINNKDLEMFSFLASREDVDFNMIDKLGDNILIRIVFCAGAGDIKNFDLYKKAMEILQKLPPEKLDVNYINADWKESLSALSYALSIGESNVIKEILKFPNIDTNLNPTSEIPLFFTVLKNESNIDLLEQLFLHPNTDKKLILDNLDLDKLEENKIYLSGKDLKCINNCIDKYKGNKSFAEIKTIYDENGFLTLDEIEKLADNDNKENKLSFEKINIVGENIGHMLAEQVVDENNPQEMKQLRRIFKKLQACGYDFNSKDNFGTTPLAKSIVCENKTLENMFRIYGDDV